MRGGASRLSPARRIDASRGRYHRRVSVEVVPAGFAFRDASLEDCDEVADLINAVNVAEVGIPWTTAEELRDQLTNPGHEPGDDVVLIAVDGSLAGYLTTWRDEPLTTIHQIAFVRPALWGRGLSAWLLNSGEARARAMVERGHPNSTVLLRVSRWSGNDAAIPLFESLGYEPARVFHEMRIELSERSEDPQVPEGIVIRTFEPGRDERAVHAALAEAFEDHWGMRFESLDVWKHDQIDGASSNFDPELWFLALDGDDVVGVICCRDSSASSPDAANVDELGVRRAWRGRGIARALLLTAIAEVRRRGIGAAELSVDSESLTGATRLYEKAGMRAIRSFEQWDKTLRAGDT
jgi:mycothiol synthase